MQKSVRPGRSTGVIGGSRQPDKKNNSGLLQLFNRWNGALCIYRLNPEHDHRPGFSCRYEKIDRTGVIRCSLLKYCRTLLDRFSGFIGFLN